MENGRPTASAAFRTKDIVRIMTAKADAGDFTGRFREIVSDPLNVFIRRHPDAGRVEESLVVLHNGLRVPIRGPDAYYGDFSAILAINRGVHEPLEELVFQQVLDILPDAPTMLELGAYWGHYSMWLKCARPLARVQLVEPDADCLRAGRKNFDRNGLSGEFVQAFVGKGHLEIDRHLAHEGLRKLDILHADIQGYEVEMLEGAVESLSARRIDYLFVSTHSQRLHAETMDVLRRFGYRVEVEADFDDATTSYDGFVFASSPSVDALLSDFSPMSRSAICNARPEVLTAYIRDVADRLAARAHASVP